MKVCRDFEVGKTAYSYKCKICGLNEDLYYHMDEERPKSYQCPMCKTKNSMYRVYGNNKIIIPFQWGTTDNEIKFDKRPSRRKQYF